MDWKACTLTEGMRAAATVMWKVPGGGREQDSCIAELQPAKGTELASESARSTGWISSSGTEVKQSRQLGSGPGPRAAHAAAAAACMHMHQNSEHLCVHAW
jgi:hypothetical protein